MKKYILFGLFAFLLSCNTKSVEQNPCVEKIWFQSRKAELIPSLVKIKISNSKDISKKIEAGELRNIILYSIKEENRDYFIKGDYYEIKDDSVTLQVVSSFFDSERNHIWTAKEIEDVISKSEVGLVFKSDTLRISTCK